MSKAAMGLFCLALGMSAACGKDPHVEVGTGTNAPPTGAQCASGSRYSLCGGVSVAQRGQETASGRSVVGSFENAPMINGKTFGIQGGGFNAVR